MATVTKAGARQVGDMVREREMRIKSNTKISKRGIRDESRGEEELLDRCVERSGTHI